MFPGLDLANYFRWLDSPPIAVPYVWFAKACGFRSLGRISVDVRKLVHYCSSCGWMKVEKLKRWWAYKVLTPRFLCSIAYFPSPFRFFISVRMPLCEKNQ